MKEQWKPVYGYTGSYEVSNKGQIRSLNRRGYTGKKLIGKILLQNPAGFGHLRVTLWKNGKPKSKLVHTLVAHAFLGSKPAGNVVRHGPQGKCINTIDNLSYGTKSEDCFDCYRDGTFTTAKPVKCSNGEIYPSASVAARALGLCFSGICKTCRGESTHCGGYTWEFI